MGLESENGVEEHKMLLYFISTTIDMHFES